MKVFVDTSGFYALADADDRFHLTAKEKWERAWCGETALFTTDWILVETTALIQKRIGMESAVLLWEEIVPHLKVIHIDESTLEMALDEWKKNRNISLVDAGSFAVMRKMGIFHYIGFDKDFIKAGFKVYG